MSRAPALSSSRQNATVIAWQGWRVDLPNRWSAVKLEGDYDKGYALFADLHRPRIGMRWATVSPRKWDADRWVERSLRAEVGQLAAAEAVAHPAPPTGEWIASKLYLEPEPPGRDVWLAYSKTSGRVLELIHHAHRRERILADTILPTLVDLPAGEGDLVPWSIFDLSLRLSGDWRLASQRLNAGDLSLRFVNRRQTLAVRQIAVAELALQRQPLARWLEQQEHAQARFYRSDAKCKETSQGSTMLKRAMRRRRRFAFMRWLPPRVLTLARHDAARDRLVFVQGTDEDVVERVLETIGWASRDE